MLDAKQMVDGIATKAGLSAQSCEAAIGTILSVIQHEAGPQADPIFANLPGAAQLAASYDVMAPQPATGSGGLFVALTSAVASSFGEKASAAINGLERLEQTGLTTAEIRTAASAMVDQLKAALGPKAVSSALASVPALRTGLGM